MSKDQLRFTSLADAIVTLHATPEPLVLTRFESAAAERLIIAVNEAAAAIPNTPVPGEHPDNRRDPNFTADVELDYLYRQLIERGHAAQVLVFDNRHVELTMNRVHVEGDERVYAFVSPRRREPPSSV